MPRLQYQHHSRLQVSSNHYPFFELPFFDFVLVYWARCRHHSVVDAIDYLHHRSSSNTLFSLSLTPSLYLLDRHENFFYHYKNPDSDIVIVYFGMWVLHPFYPLFAHLFTEQNSSISRQKTHLSHRLFWLHRPQSHQKPRLRKTRRYLADKYDRMHTRTNDKLITLSVHNHHHLRSSLWLSPFSCRQCHYLRPAKCRLQIEFQSRY